MLSFLVCSLCVCVCVCVCIYIVNTIELYCTGNADAFDLPVASSMIIITSLLLTFDNHKTRTQQILRKCIGNCRVCMALASSPGRFFPIIAFFSLPLMFNNWKIKNGLGTRLTWHHITMWPCSCMAHGLIYNYILRLLI